MLVLMMGMCIVLEAPPNLPKGEGQEKARLKLNSKFKCKFFNTSHLGETEGAL